MASDSQRGVRTVEVSCRLLAILADAPQPLMLRDVARLAELTPGQAHAHLVSLRKMDMVEQDADTGRYRLGPFALHVGLARLRATDPYRMAAAGAPELAERVGLMVALTVWGTYGPTIVLVQEAGHQIHANVRAGGVFNVGGTATGRVFAAHLPPSMVIPVLEHDIERAKVQSGSAHRSREAFEAEIKGIRRTGFATTLDKPVPGISAAAAPVFDHGGRMQLAVTLIGPTESIDLTADGPHVRALLDFTRGLSRKLGWRGPVADRPTVEMVQ